MSIEGQVEMTDRTTTILPASPLLQDILCLAEGGIAMGVRVLSVKISSVFLIPIEFLATAIFSFPLQRVVRLCAISHLMTYGRNRRCR